MRLRKTLREEAVPRPESDASIWGDPRFVAWFQARLEAAAQTPPFEVCGGMRPVSHSNGDDLEIRNALSPVVFDFSEIEGRILTQLELDFGLEMVSDDA